MASGTETARETLSFTTPLRENSRTSLGPMSSPKTDSAARAGIEQMKAQLDAMGHTLEVYGDAAAECEIMRERIRSLEERLSGSEEEVKTRSRELWETRARLEQQRRELAREREALRRESEAAASWAVEAAEARATEAEKRAQQAETDSKRLLDGRTAAEANLAEAEKRAFKAETDSKRALTSLAATEAKLAEAQARASSAEASLAAAESRAAEASERSAASELGAHGLRASLATAEARASEAEKRAEAAELDVRSLQASLAASEAQVTEANAVAAQSEARAHALLSELDAAAEVEQRAERLQRELEALRSAVAEAEELAHGERARANGLLDSLHAHEAEASRLANEVQTSLLAKEHLEDQLDVLHEEKERLVAELAAPRPQRASCQGDAACESGGGCEQSRELLLTLIQLKQDCEQTETENRSLKAVMAAFDAELSRHAEGIGHVNHRQKIRYTMQLKEQISSLLAELKGARQHILRLQTGKMNESLLDALASLGMPMSQSFRGAPASEGNMSARRSNRRQTIGGCHRSEEDDRERACSQEGGLEESLERIGIDFLHLKALVERVVMLADDDGAAGSASFAALLQRLRKAIEGARSDGWKGVAAAAGGSPGSTDGAPADVTPPGSKVQPPWSPAPQRGGA